MKAKYPKHESWKIVYSDYSGLQKKAIELLNREIGKRLIRKQGVYTLYVLPCEKETENVRLERNAIVIGLYGQSPLIQKFVSENEIPENGYLMRVAANPEDEDCSIVLITAREEINLYYGACAFVDDYPHLCAPVHGGGLQLTEEIFDEKLQPITLASAPKTQTRGIFSWGHPINDYKEFIENMARQRLNQLIVWNDFVPINAKEIIDYAHSFGIEFLWGYAWGWIDGCGKITDISEETLKKLKDDVIRKYEEVYAPLGADGIYFQSFTERNDEYIGGRLIAEAVTSFVNDTAGELLKRYPRLKLQFGLHALSVHNRLSEIAKVDKRVEILWEDGGEFPFGYRALVTDEKAYEKTLQFVEDILYLRGLDAPTGIVFKGFMTLDWTRFVSQSGPFILGENAREISEHDRTMRLGAWRKFKSDWLKYGKYATRMAKRILEITQGKVNLCMAGMFDGGIWYPEAVCSEIFWNPEAEFDDLSRTVCARECVK